jgi:hypothetical protein
MCEHHALDRRALLLAGAGVTTTAALLTVTGPAAADQTSSLEFSGTFTGVGTPDWHYLPFEVPDGVRAIAVSYDAPATSTGLGFSVNVVDIGIFDPSGIELGNTEGFRGWSGGARKSFRIATDAATPGYLAGPITPGVWRVILGPVGIVPPGVDWSVTVTLEYGEPEGPPFVANPAPRQVAGTGPGWYRGDLHTHTVHSDGTHTQASLAALAQDAGLDFIGSSEHNTSTAGLTWGAHAPDDLLVIVGEEVTTRVGHWQAMGLPAGAWVDWRYRTQDQMKQYADLVRSLGGLVIANHPWAPTPGSMWGFGYGFPQVDAIEIWNGPWTLDDQVGVVAWHTMLTTGKFRPVVGTSDTHRPTQTVGKAQTVVYAETLSTTAIMDGVRRGRSWLAESSAVDLTFEASLRGTTVTCGERLPAKGVDLVDVRLEVSGAPNCVAQIIGPALPLGAGLIGSGGSATVTAKVPAGLAKFVRAEVRRLDSAVVVNPLEGVPALTMVAMTNPIFLGGA